MPTYLFRCEAHGEFELVRKMSEAGDPAVCPECGLDANRVYTSPPILFACDGFHATDYGKGNDGLTGTKADLLNRNWSKAWGEKPPPPDRNVPQGTDKK